MKTSMNLGLLAIATATMTIHAPALADDGDNYCGISGVSTVINAVSGTLVEAAALMLLDDIQASDICLVNVNDALNDDVLDLLAVQQIAALNELQIGALQRILSDLIVVTDDGELVDIEDVLTDINIDLTDVLAVDAAPDSIVLFYLPPAL